jgi:hypothetical protein
MALHGEPEKITIDKSGANTAAIESYNAEYCSDIELRQCEYLNNIVEQDHRAIKRIVRPMPGFKVFRCARILITGIETMHMIRKGQLDGHDGEVLSAADQLYSLALDPLLRQNPLIQQKRRMPRQGTRDCNSRYGPEVETGYEQHGKT